MSLFHTLGYPRHIEAYRDVLFNMLYHESEAIFQSLCWASYALKRSSSGGGIIVFPGEEKYLLINHLIDFDGCSGKGTKCPNGRDATHPNPSNPEGVPQVHRDCTFSPKTRPLNCRYWPFRVLRVPGNNRAFRVMIPHDALSLLPRLGEVRMNAVMHSLMTAFSSLWPFLSEAWWTYYAASFEEPEDQLRELANVTFQLQEDQMVSRILGAPADLRTSLLEEIADKACPVCNGTGIEFWDRVVDPKTGFATVLPVAARRFDLCRRCTLPTFGASFGSLLIDPSNKKILSADGTEYRGDNA